MIRTRDHQMVSIETEGERAVRAAALALQFDGDKGRILDRDAQLLIGCDQCIAVIRFAPQNARKSPHHRGPFDWIALMIPGAVRRDTHLAVAGLLRTPLIDGGQFLRFGQFRNFGDGERSKFGWWRVGHATGLLPGAISVKA